METEELIELPLEESLNMVSTNPEDNEIILRAIIRARKAGESFYMVPKSVYERMKIK